MPYYNPRSFTSNSTPIPVVRDIFTIGGDIVFASLVNILKIDNTAGFDSPIELLQIGGNAQITIIDALQIGGNTQTTEPANVLKMDTTSNIELGFVQFSINSIE